MELKDTVDLMLSDDYKERLKAEYRQTFIRYNKLFNMICAWDRGDLNFIPTCSRELYDEQLHYMIGYLDVLADRIKMEGVEM